MPSEKAKDARGFQSPSRYVQGPDEIKKLPKIVKNYGGTALAIIDTFFYQRFSVEIPQMFAEADMAAYVVEFSGACSDAKLNELIAYCKALPEIPDAFIGIGGGQACDITKAVGAYFRKAFIMVPTALTTDAPTSASTIINNPGEQNRPVNHYKNPDYVVVDTNITIQAPPHMLISGIGDALATYVEARASFANNNVNYVGGGGYRPTLLSMNIAKLCFDVLMEKGRAAMLAAKNHLRTPAYEDVVEATALLSGLGFENTSVSMAHGLDAGFESLPIRVLHGTGVGYCTLVQLIVENDLELFEQVFDFCKDVGMPVSTYQLGLTDENRMECINILVDSVHGKRWSVSNLPVHVSRDTLLNAILYLDAYAAERL
ncbi:MAG: iron-containing alcohol dehydrogenase [Oscillibacter sp.]|nr:iron-containing alcohol dehydrogenase [Oscillibacter sp.]